MSDLFHQRVPDEFIDNVLDTIRETPMHTYQLLTKRPDRAGRYLRAWVERNGGGGPPFNLWLGTSIESAGYLWRASKLRAAPSAVRFLSCEPLLGPMPDIDLRGIHWVIVGGESGAQHRPMQADWAREIRDQCLAAEVAFFFKQWGGLRPKSGGRELDGRTWDGMPSQAERMLVG